MSDTIKCKNPDCGKEFIPSNPRQKYCCKECKYANKKATLRRKYHDEPDKYRAEALARWRIRYDKDPEKFRRKQRELRKKDPERYREYDRKRRPKGFRAKGGFHEQRECVRCHCPIIARGWKQKYCEACAHEVELERQRISYAEKGYDKEYHRNYYGEKNLERAREKAQEQQNVLMKYASDKPLVLADPMEYASVGVLRISPNVCQCLNCNKKYVISKGVKGSGVSILRKRLAAGKNPCPYCGDWPIGSSKSYAELELARLYPNFTERNCRFHWLNGQELDLLDKVKHIAIEYNGVRWHSDLYHTDKYYHKQKCDLTEEYGIRLIQIYETEWLNKKECVLNIIDSNLGKEVTHYDSSSLVIGKVDTLVAADFMKANDVHEFDKVDIAYGMFLQGELLSVACFSLDGSVANLIGYANRLNTAVDGGLMKCVVELSREYGYIERIVAFADRRWGSFYDTLLSDAGFKRVGVTEPRCMYTDHNAKSLLISPDEINGNQLYRIYDAGYNKYELTYRK